MTREVIGNIAALHGKPKSWWRVFDDLERRDLLHAGRSGYRCGRIALNLSLQAVAATPSQLEPTRVLGSLTARGKS